MEGRQKTFLLVVIVGFILSLIFGLAYYFGRGRGILKVLMWLGIIGAVVVLLGLIVFLVFLLFKKTQIDAIRLNRSSVLRACLASPPKARQLLYFRGSNEYENRRIGIIKGVCRIESVVEKGKKDIKVMRDGKEVTLQKPHYRKIIEDCIAFKTTDVFFFSWFTGEKIVRVTQAERSNLNGDMVYLYGMAFAPELFGFLYLPKRFGDTMDVDKIINEEVNRHTVQHLLKEQINIVNESIAISPEHQKRLEKENMQTIPLAPQGGGK